MEPRNQTGAWIVLGLLVALVVTAVCIVGMSAALSTPKPTSSTRSTP